MTEPTPDIKFTPTQIARIMETPIGKDYGAYADDPIVEAARAEISLTYNAVTQSFDTAILAARVSWLTRIIQAGQVETNPESTHYNHPLRPSDTICGPLLFNCSPGPVVTVGQHKGYRLKKGQRWCGSCKKNLKFAERHVSGWKKHETNG